MAGGKETPRQKLIGLMYIVFLAMLALSASATIIQKFIFLNSSLEQGVANAKTLNDSKIEGLKKAVEKNPRYSGVLDQAKLVKDKSEAVIKYIQDLKEEVVKKSGGRDEEGNYAGAKSTDELAEMMLGPSGAKNRGKALELKKKLDAYVTEMNAMTGKNYAFLALDGKEDPMFKKDKDQKNKSFGELSFEETPMIAGLAVMSDKQARIANMEAEVLAGLATKVGAKDFKFDVIRGTYSALSSTVAAGTDYEADMYVTAQSSAIVPTMKFKGSAVKVENGIGHIKFRAAAGSYDKEGNSKQNWEGQIVMPKPDGEGDTTFIVKGEYVVAKPVIDVKSAAVQALYENCGNPLNIQVPALGATYQPSFSASNASVVNGGDKGQVIIVPNSRNKVAISVSSGGSSIGKVEFDVRAVPRPTLEIRQGGAPVNMRQGLNAPGPAALEIVPIPDPSFAGALPKEARYRTASGEIVLARGKSPVTRVAIGANGVNLASLRSQARAGDRIVIEVKTVQRRNFRDATEDIAIPSNMGVFTIPLN